MPSNLVWRRCGACAQLTLVPVSANVCWHCGTPLPEGPLPPVSTVSPFGSDPATALSPDPAAFCFREATPPAARDQGLSLDEAYLAHRLLASVFPNDVEL